MNVKNVSKPMNVENTYTNLYITNLALKAMNSKGYREKSLHPFLF